VAARSRGWRDGRYTSHPAGRPSRSACRRGARSSAWARDRLIAISVASSPSSPAHRQPPIAFARTGRRAPLIRLGLRPCNVSRSRRTVRKRPTSEPSRCGVRPRPSHPCRAWVRPCGFSRLASPAAFIVFVGDAVRAGHSRPHSLWACVPGSHRTILATWPRPDPGPPATFLGFALRPSQYCSTSAGDGAFVFASAPRTHLPFRPLSAASFIDRGIRHNLRRTGRHWAAAPGVWPRGRAVPCDPSIPLKLLRTGSNELTSHDCLGLRRSSRALIAHHRPATSGGLPPVGVCT